MSFIGDKVKKILKEGVRQNTRKPVSKSNPRRKVPHKQAIAIALSIARKKGIKAAKFQTAIHKGKKKNG